MLHRDKHRELMFQILQDIFMSEVWNNIAFKWWTACYFLYGLDRFSTDLDFDLLGSVDNIDKVMINILQQYGTIKKGNKLILSYGEDDVNIKIDINRKIWKYNIYEVVDFYGTSIKVQNKATIFANKLVALTERSTNRDIYDVYSFFKHLFDINEDVVIERTGKNLHELYVMILEKLQKLPKHHKILDWLWEMLDIEQKVFVKNKLLWLLMGIIEMRKNKYRVS